MSDLRAISAEFEALAAKHGVETYAVLIQDPDSFNVLSTWDGNAAVVHFEATGLATRILQKHHGERPL